jgi:hypothetical protein
VSVSDPHAMWVSVTQRYALQFSVWYLIFLVALVLIVVPRRAQLNLLQSLSWLLWLLFSIVAISLQWLMVIYSITRIALTLLLFANIKLLSYLSKFLALVCQPCLWRAKSQTGFSDLQRLRTLYRDLERAKDYVTYKAIGLEIDFMEGNEKWKEQDESDEYDWKLLKNHVEEIASYRHNNDIHKLVFTLRKVLHRNFGHINNEMLYKHCIIGTKYLVDDFLKEVCNSLKLIADADANQLSMEEKFNFFKLARHNVGKTALCLSGGGSLSMYHMGVVRALLQHGCLPTIVSGTSGGSIMAAVLAVSFVFGFVEK